MKIMTLKRGKDFFLIFNFFFIVISRAVPVVEYTQEKPALSHSLTVCRGQMRSIACPNLQLLHIYNAFYGKLSGHDCQSPVTQLREQIPTCFSKNAPTIIRETCQGQQSCDLYAEDSLYDDPCPSVTKYLFVSFTCQGKSTLGDRLKMYNMQKIPDISSVETAELQQQNELVDSLQPKSAIVCPGQTSSIYCPALKLLKIKSAFYGKQQGRDCTGAVTNDKTPTCYASDTVRTVKDMCDGQQSCDLYSEPELYGRTLCAQDTQKHLQVTYMCEGHSDLDKQLAQRKEGFKKLQEFLRQPLVAVKNLRQFNQPSNPNLVVRSSLPHTGDKTNTYDPWQDWANFNEYEQWMNSNPWIDSIQKQQQQQQQQAQLYAQYPFTNDDLLALSRPITVNAGVRQEIPQMQPQQQTYSGISSYFKSPAPIQRPCDQCNGDCRNYLCYGCGGCPVPPPEQQLYYYQYQKQDAAYHDAFIGHAMELSGLVLSPVPKMKSRRAGKKKDVSQKSKIADEDSDEDDNDDDGNDDDAGEAFDEDDEDDDNNDVDDESDTDDVKHTKNNSTKRKNLKKSTLFFV